MKALVVSHAIKTNSQNQHQQHQQHSAADHKKTSQTNLVDSAAEDSTTTLTQSPSTIHRSSSHESHLRSKVNNLNGDQLVPSLSATAADQEQHSNQHLSKTSLLDCGGAGGDAASRRLSEGSEMSSKCTSGQASPNLQSPTHLSSSYKVNGIFLDDPNKSKFINFSKIKKNLD